MSDRIRVGLLGANPDKGWGSSVHVPAIGYLDGFQLTAVATTRMESASRAAEAFGARYAFADVDSLVSHPEVDVVVVAVKAPDHHAAALAALAAGKHVYCEWPLAANSTQAAEMTALASERGVRAMVGLQARGAPALARVRDLLRDGCVGRLIAVRMHCALPGGGARRSQEGLYVIDRANGASTLAIQGGHAIDALRFCVGDWAEFSSLAVNQFPEVEVIETGERRPKDAPDQVAVSGMLANGAVATVQITGGAAAGHGISLDLFGTEGALSVGWDGGLNFQMSELRLRGARLPERILEEWPIPDGYDPGLLPADFAGRPPYPGVMVPRATVANVVNLYRDLERAIRSGSDPSPSFADGLSLHRLLDRIETGGTERKA